MPISFSMIVLSSQLVVAVADQVPKFDIARSCKLISNAAASVSEQQPIERCLVTNIRRSRNSKANGPHSPPQAEHSAAPWRPLVTRQVTSVC